MKIYGPPIEDVAENGYNDGCEWVNQAKPAQIREVVKWDPICCGTRPFPTGKSLGDIKPYFHRIFNRYNYLNYFDWVVGRYNPFNELYMDKWFDGVEEYWYKVNEEYRKEFIELSEFLSTYQGS